MAERKKSAGQARGDKKERILRSAIKVFANKGFFNAKVSEVAREAGVADGTIYLYFDNKDDLLIQVFEESMEQIIVRLRNALTGAETPEEKIHRFIMAHLTMVQENPELAEVITVELRQSSKFMKEYRNPGFGQYLKMIADILEEGAATGVLRTDMEPWLIARALFGMLDELARSWVLGRRFDVTRSGEIIYEFFMHGMRANVPAEPQRSQS